MPSRAPAACVEPEVRKTLHGIYWTVQHPTLHTVVFAQSSLFTVPTHAARGSVVYRRSANTHTPGLSGKLLLYLPARRR